MTWQTKRQLRRKLAAARYERDLAVSAKEAAIEEQRDAKQLAQMVADRDQRIAELEATCRSYADNVDGLLNSLRTLGGFKPMPRPGRRTQAAGVDLVKRGGEQ